MPKLSATELQITLHQFTGSEQFYRLNLFYRWLIATDGVKWLAENAGAYWFIDAIVSHQPTCRADKMLRYMQFWTLTVDQVTHKAVLTCERDKGDVVIRQNIEFTDFPLPEVRIWVEGIWGQQMTVMLPSER